MKYFDEAERLVKLITRAQGISHVAGDLTSELYIRLYENNYEPESKEDMAKTASAYINLMIRPNDKFHKYHLDSVIEFNEDFVPSDDDSLYDRCIDTLIEVGYSEDESVQMVESLLYGTETELERNRKHKLKNKTVKLLQKYL